MGVSVIEIGRKEPDRRCRVTEPIPNVCQKCGAPLSGNKCEYCGTEYVDTATQKELAELESKQKKLEAELRAKRLEIAAQEQTARLYELIGMNAELQDIREEMKKL